jgi:hypothetical protein
MTSPLGPAAFFALEAGECLDQLDILFRASGGPSGDELVRLARVLRGSALMAHHPQLARAAAGFEALGRAVRGGTRAWDAGTREQALQAIEEYRLLVRRVSTWDEGDAARAAQLGADLDTLAGRGPSGEERFRRGAGADLQTGVRAFVAREGALVASALDRAARAIRTAPEDREPLYMVLRRMQSLQGLAELPELAPLPEILDGIELAVGDLSRLHAPPPGVEAVLAAGAVALSRAARDIVEHGVPAVDTDEARRFTELLVEAFAVERDVVPIETLFTPGDAEPMRRATDVLQFSPPAPPGSLELVSLGEHLGQTAGLLEEARTDTELDLRLYRLIGTLRRAATPHGEAVCDALGVLGRSAREAVAAGVARSRRAEFATALRETGNLLRSSGAIPDRMFLSRRILDAAFRIDQLHDPAAARPVSTEVPPPPAAELPPQPAAAEVLPQAAAAAAPPVPPAEAAVPIESLGYDAEPASAVDDAGSPLAAALTGYQRHRRERGRETPSVDEFLGRRAERTPGERAPAEEATHVVPIELLCYRGRAALERAAEVRRELAARLERPAELADIQPLVQELLDLVPLALAEPA